MKSVTFFSIIFLFVGAAAQVVLSGDQEQQALGYPSLRLSIGHEEKGIKQLWCLVHEPERSQWPSTLGLVSPIASPETSPADDKKSALTEKPSFNAPKRLTFSDDSADSSDDSADSSIVKQLDVLDALRQKTKKKSSVNNQRSSHVRSTQESSVWQDKKLIKPVIHEIQLTMRYAQDLNRGHVVNHWDSVLQEVRDLKKGSGFERTKTRQYHHPDDLKEEAQNARIRMKHAHENAQKQARASE